MQAVRRRQGRSEARGDDITTNREVTLGSWKPEEKAEMDQQQQQRW